MASKKIAVIDSHIHLAENWQEGESGLPQHWLRFMGPEFRRNWTEKQLVEEASRSDVFDVQGFVFIECANGTRLEEAKWVLKMAESDDSKVVAVVVNIPVPDGAKAVNDFVDSLRDDKGNLSKHIKGGRVVLLGAPMPAADACLSATYLEGLGALGKLNLHWEWCCHPKALPFVAQATAKFPNMKFVLDHAGHNGDCDDFDTWAPAIAEVAKNPNVVCKVGAVEQWSVGLEPSRHRFFDHAFKCFGENRLIAESNWFVNEAMGDSYSDVFDQILAACKRANYTDEQINKVFYANSKTVYSL